MQYLKKEVSDEVDFLDADFNIFLIKNYYKVILSILMDMFKHSQSTRNNEFSIPSQYLEKEVRDGVHFLHANKHQSFYKLAISFLMEVARHVQSTENRKLVISLQYIKKNYCNCFVF